MPPFVPLNVDSEVTRARMLQAMFHHIRSDDPSQYLACTIGIKNLLGSEDPPTNEVVQSGLLPRLVEFTSSDIPGLKFEAASVLSVFSITHDHIGPFIGCGAVPVFIQLLSCYESEEKLHLAVSTLENVAYHRPQDVVAHQEALPALSLLRFITDSENIRESICQIVSHITNGTEAHQEVIASDIMRFVIRLLKHGTLKTQEFAVSAVAGITCKRNVNHIMSLVNEGCIKRLVGVLRRLHVQTVRRALSALDDILRSYDRDLYEGYPYVDKILQCDGYEVLLHLMEEHDDIRVKDESRSFIYKHLSSGPPLW